MSVKYVADENIGALLYEVQWRDRNLTFSFPQATKDYGNSDPYLSQGLNFLQSFSGIDEELAQVVRNVLEQISAVSGLTFNEMKEDPGKATIRFASCNLGDDLGTSFLPHDSELGGDVWFTRDRCWVKPEAPGSSFRELVLHEVGHALGLKHGHTAATGERGPLSREYDSRQYTVMTYRGGVGGELEDGPESPETLMMLDVLALQEMYGPNYGTRDGATKYSWSPDTGETFIDGVGQGSPMFNTIFATIWDGGGHDIYDFTVFDTPVRMDLRPGSYSIASQKQLATIGSDHEAFGNVYNALLHNGNPRSLIEEAWGGSGDDALRGNQTDNVLRGGCGNDLLWGYDGADWLVGDDGDDGALGGEGNDFLLGGAGSDRLAGEAGRDHLFGGEGDDALNGGCGADILNGGEGNDVLAGGLGEDLFVFAPDSGVDTVVDYGVRSRLGEHDRLDVTAFGFHRQDAARLLEAAEQDGSSAVLALGGSVKIILVGVSKNDLSAADFLFA